MANLGALRQLEIGHGRGDVGIVLSRSMYYVIWETAQLQ